MIRAALALLLTAPSLGAAPAPRSIVLSAPMVVVIEPPQVLPCDRPGWWLIAFGQEPQRIVSAAQPVGALGVSVVPALPGRIFCEGFES